MEHRPPSIIDTVQAKLSSGSVKMRSRTSFILHALLLGILAFFILSCGLLALSFVFFSAYQSGQLFLLGFGWTGVLAFLALFPWGLIVLVLLLIVLFQYLLNRITDAYKIPIIFFFVLLIGAFTLLGLLLTPAHTAIFERVEKHQVPYLKEWYEDVFSSHERHGIFRGVVTATSTGRIEIEYDDADFDEDDQRHLIVLPDEMDETLFMLGDEVFIAGELEDGEIEAYGVHLFRGR